jgi:hypothetical protein
LGVTVSSYQDPRDWQIPGNDYLVDSSIELGRPRGCIERDPVESLLMEGL